MNHSKQNIWGANYFRAAITCVSLLFLGCTTAPPFQDREVLRLAQRQLIVLPVSTPSDASGFPVDCRNVITAAHVIKSRPGAVVSGFPTQTFLKFIRTDDDEIPIEDDWCVIGTNSDIWHHNRVVGSPVLTEGELLVAAGYPSINTPACFYLRASQQPTFVLGRVLPRRRSDAKHVHRLAIPNFPAQGMSGGPVARLDNDGSISIVGMIQGGGKFLTPGGWAQTCTFISFTYVEIRSIKRMRMVRPGERIITDPDVAIFSGSTASSTLTPKLFLPSYLRERHN